MKVYTYSEARQNLATLLDQATKEGEVRVKRRDGQVFVIRSESGTKSPLEVTGLDLEISKEEILGFVEAGRKPLE